MIELDDGGSRMRVDDGASLVTLRRVTSALREMITAAWGAHLGSCRA